MSKIYQFINVDGGDAAVSDNFVAKADGYTIRVELGTDGKPLNAQITPVPGQSYEPTFTLRARDLMAAPLVRMWADFAALMGTKREKVVSAEAVAKAMEQWDGPKRNTVQTFYNFDGCEWATFCFNHVPVNEFLGLLASNNEQYQIVVDYMEAIDDDRLLGTFVSDNYQHLWMRKFTSAEKSEQGLDADQEHWDWCVQSDHGAKAVTALRYDSI